MKIEDCKKLSHDDKQIFIDKFVKQEVKKNMEKKRYSLKEKKIQETCPEPKKGESEEDYIGRAMTSMKDDDMDQDQKLAIAYSKYRSANESVIILKKPIKVEDVILEKGDKIKIIKKNFKEYYYTNDAYSEYVVDWYEKEDEMSVTVYHKISDFVVWHVENEELFEHLENGLFEWENNESILDYLNSVKALRGVNYNENIKK